MNNEYDSKQITRALGLIKDEDTVLLTAAFRTAMKHASNLIEIHNVKELIHYTSTLVAS